MRLVELAKICVEPRHTRWLDRVFVRQEILFEPKTTTPTELVDLFESVVTLAAYLKKRVSAQLEQAQ